MEHGGLFAIGNVSPARMRLGAACVEAVTRAGEALRVGASAASVAKSIATVAEDAGYGHSGQYGHGTGLDDRDAPMLTAEDQTRIVSGMVVAVHPVFADRAGKFRAGACATYVVADDESRRLSRWSSDIRHVAAK